MGKLRAGRTTSAPPPHHLRAVHPTPRRTTRTSTEAQHGTEPGTTKGTQMTETANAGTSTRKAAGADTGTGLSLTRVFSTEGTHPYDEITWERRDVVQTNWKTGETVFEQKGVEFPDFWSLNASTIVTAAGKGNQCRVGSAG